jgi:SAM-dependent methyltransferase
MSRAEEPYRPKRKPKPRTRTVFVVIRTRRSARLLLRSRDRGRSLPLSLGRIGVISPPFGLSRPLWPVSTRSNAAAAGVTSAIFFQGHIEDIPPPDEHVDVVISNCVLCLSTNKPRVLAEAFRVLRAGRRLGTSDVIA